MIIRLGETTTAIEQRLNSGFAFNGKIPDDDNPSFDGESTRTLKYNCSENAGLFDFSNIDAGDGHIYVVSMQIHMNGSHSWILSMTSGERDGLGTPGEDKKDDDGWDASIANGSGSDIIRIDQEVIPGEELIRFTTSTSVNDPAVVRLMITNSYTAAGRTV